MRSTEEIAKEWFGIATIEARWKPSENQAGAVEGACQGLMVTWPELGRRAYMKPTKSLKHAGPAREKLGSDLARLIGVRVPPAVLMKRTDPGDHPSTVVLSLVLHDTQYSWRMVKAYFEQDLEAPDDYNQRWIDEGVRATRAFVFDTWVGQQDHENHPHNIILGMTPEGLDDELVFLDYERAFGADGSWKRGGWLETQPAGFPQNLKALLSAEFLEETTSKIEQLDEADIEGLVRRIPVEHLCREEQATIIAGLLGRRKLLRPALEGAIQ